MIITPVDMPLFCSIGTDFMQQIQIVNQDNEPIDLTNSIVDMSVFTSFGGGNTIIELTNDDGVVVSGEQGLITLSISRENTALFPKTGLQTATQFFGNTCTCEGMTLTGLLCFYNLYITINDDKQQYVSNSVFLLLG